MKKIVSLVLAVLMAVTLLCGCAKNQSASPSLVGGYNDIRYTYIFDGNDTLHLISSDTPSRSSRDVLYERIG